MELTTTTAPGTEIHYTTTLGRTRTGYYSGRHTTVRGHQAFEIDTPHGSPIWITTDHLA